MVASVAVGIILASPGSTLALPGTLDAAFGTAGLVSSTTGSGATGVAYVPTGTNGDLAVSDSSVPPLGSSTPQQFQVAVFTPSGAPNTSFGTGGVVDSFPGYALAVAAVPAGLPNAGNIVAAGYASSAPGCGLSGLQPAIAEYNPDGTVAFETAPRSVTASITTGTTLTLNSGTFTPADVGSTVCGPGIPTGTTITKLLGSSPSSTAQLSASATNGSFIKTTIAQLPGNGGQYNAVAIDPVTGNVVAAGQVLTASGSFEGLVVRLTPAGALDSSFNSTGYDATFAPPASSSTSLTDFDAVAVEPSGVPNVAEDIVAGGYSIDTTGSQEATLAAFGNAGLDSNFGTSGIVLPPAMNTVNGLTILPTGNVVVVGTDAPSSTASFLVQYQASGSQVITFGGSSNNGVVTVAPTATTSYQLTSVAYDPFSGYLSVGGGTATTGGAPHLGDRAGSVSFRHGGGEYEFRFERHGPGPLLAVPPGRLSGRGGDPAGWQGGGRRRGGHRQR